MESSISMMGLKLIIVAVFQRLHCHCNFYLNSILGCNIFYEPQSPANLQGIIYSFDLIHLHICSKRITLLSKRNFWVPCISFIT